MSRILSDAFISSYKNKKPPFGANGLAQFVAHRTYARLKDDGKKEQWFETIGRCVNGAQDIGAQFTEDEAMSLYDHMFNMRGLVAGRCLWQLGVDKMIDRFGFGSLVNCYYTNIESIDDIRYLFTMLTLGGGVGVGIKRSMVHEFPKVKPNVRIIHERTNDADFIVPDSREGWAELLVKVLESFFVNGKSFSYSTILVRPPGAELATFGGRASGPQALIDGVSDVCNILSQRAGKKIRSIDALDAVNIIGRIAVAGSSRRSAIIALGDTDDYSFIRAKNWSTGKVPAWRSQSNNSCYIDSYEQIVDEFWKGYTGDSEPYGLVNIDLAKQYGRLGEKKVDSDVEGFNPCAEQILESRGCCNLSTVFLPNIKSREQLFEVSRLLFKVQKAITGLHHIDKTTEEITHRTRRVGQSITGWMQSTHEQISWVNDAYKHLTEFDKSLSKAWGVPESIRLTTCQPSGTMSILPFVTAGCHPAYSNYFIRRVRLSSDDKLVQQAIKNGYNVEYETQLDGSKNHDISVVEFPCSVPPGTILANNLTAVDQLNWVVKVNTIWSDSAVSSTIYYKKEELEDIKLWLKDNYENSIKSVSFLLHKDHGFAQPPYEEIDETTFNKMQSKITNTTFEDESNDELDLECAGGHCPIR